MAEPNSPNQFPLIADQFRLANRVADELKQTDQLARQVKLANATYSISDAIKSQIASKTAAERIATLSAAAETAQRFVTFGDEMSLRLTHWMETNAAQMQSVADRAFEQIARMAKAAEALNGSAFEAFNIRLNLVVVRAESIGAKGWTVSPHMALSQLWELADVEDAEAADRLMLEWLEQCDPDLLEIKHRLISEARIAPYHPVLQQAFRAIGQGDYALTIPILMIVVEHVIRQLNPSHRSQPKDLKRVFKKNGSLTRAAEKDLFSASVSLSLSRFINDKWLTWPESSEAEPPVLLRHVLLHGRKAPPNEKVEVIRLLNALEAGLDLCAHLADN